MTTQYRHFQSANEFADFFDKKRSLNGPLRGYGSAGEQAQINALQGMCDLRNGTLENLDEAQRIVDELALTIDLASPQPQLDVVGAYPDVPSYLSGVPEDMWNMVPTYTDKTPIVLYVGVTSQGSIPNSALVKRGTAIAAFVLAMSNIRQVIVRPYVAIGGEGYRNYRYDANAQATPQVEITDANLPNDGDRHTILSWDIQTSPMVLSELMCIARPEVIRFLGIEVCQQVYGSVATRDVAFHPDTSNEERMRTHLNVQPDDIYLPQITELDPLINDPIGWVRTQVSKYISGDATDYMTEEQAEYMHRTGAVMMPGSRLPEPESYPSSPTPEPTPTPRRPYTPRRRRYRY